jgi:hypothetical protein
MATKMKYSGMEVVLGEKSYTLPPLTLGQLRNGMAEKIKEHDSLDPATDWLRMIDIKGEIVLEALRRNYAARELSDAYFYEYTNLSNIGQMWLGLLGLSGLSAGEAAAAESQTTAS